MLTKVNYMNLKKKTLKKLYIKKKDRFLGKTRLKKRKEMKKTTCVSAEEARRGMSRRRTKKKKKI